MKKFGPRDWSPRAPEADDFNEAYDLWSQIKGELKELGGIGGIQNGLSKMAEALQGTREKLTKDDLLDLNSAIWAVNHKLERIYQLIHTEAMPMTVELAKWVKKAVKEGERK